MSCIECHPEGKEIDLFCRGCNDLEEGMEEIEEKERNSMAAK